MEAKEEVFISYSYDSPEHIEAVLQLSNKLRSEGINCTIDQYEESPDEGWPRWMDKQIRNAQYVLIICTETYYQRIIGDEEEEVGLGARWEGNLIFQHLYDAGTINKKFIPVILDEKDQQYIPDPLKGFTKYDLSRKSGYDNLYRRLTGQPKIKKPKLGKRKPLPSKPVKTDPTLYITGPIQPELWDSAKWSATFFVIAPDRPPVLGIAFKNEKPAREIFEAWHQRYGENDELEEIRISIIEGPIENESLGYSVHITSDPEAFRQRLKENGQDIDGDLLMSVSRINRMNPPPETNNLARFKTAYRTFKTYFLIPGIISKDGKDLKPIFELGIFKSKVLFRHSSDVGEDDIDIVVTGTGSVSRSPNDWP
ncbi:toll/interleukin-1 receptor domain-containing protein [Emcibacter sp.]|uniref:toll/interleukin-1 receptor domain-containing protein n=1 Tax=Emcibacter sp. TaxID=1979954 RepID=UPI003A90C087